MAWGLLAKRLVRGISRYAAFAAWMLCGCAADGEGGQSDDRVGRAIQPIIEGAPSTAEHDAVVVLGLFRDGVRRGLCSATLVAPNLVLTARHCVSETDALASCYTDGSAIAGAGLHGDYTARELAVFVARGGVASSADDETLATAHGVKLIVDDSAKTICNRDVAFVLLDRPLTGRIASIRLGAPRPHEMLTVVGWGVTETGVLPTMRMARADVPLVGRGPMLYPHDPRYGFGNAEFMTGESVCLGDSGGPAMTRSGVVVGVASRTGNGQPRDPANLAATCTGSMSHAIYTHLGTATALVARAFAQAGYLPFLEEATLASAFDPQAPRDVTRARSAQTGSIDPAGEPGTPSPLRGASIAEAAAGATASDEGGCSIARAGEGHRATGLGFALAVAACVVRRRRIR